MDDTLITEARIEEIWHTARTLEPVRFGLPLAAGMVRNVEHLALKHEDKRVPLQARCLSRWPDGSVRWALLDLQADLDLRKSSILRVFLGQSAPLSLQPGIRTEETDERLAVDTGALALDIPKRGERLAFTLSRHGQPEPVHIGVQIIDERLGELRPGSRFVRVASAGPLVTDVIVEAEYLSESLRVLDATILLRFHAGKPWLYAQPLIQSRELDLQISRFRVSVQPAHSEPTELRSYTRMKKARVSDTEVIYTREVDARSSPIWYEDSPEPCWALWRGDTYGVTGSIRNADHHFPTRLAAIERGLELDLYAEGYGPFHFYPWMGKSYEVMLMLVEPDKTGYELTLDSALFQRPVRPVCSPEYYASCGALGDIFPASRKYAAFEGLISTSLRERTVGAGAMHYGDEPNHGYTYDERGHGEMVWTNGEYDTPRMLLMQYARTSNRAWFEAGEAAALHMMDVDFLRGSPNPRWAGGVCCHEGDHRIAAYAGPSHEWCEGLIDYYHLTGCDRALETALSVGDNVCRYIEDGEFDRVGTYALRELGWGLTAIAGCLRVTGDDRFRRTGLRAVELLRRWVEEFGGLAEVDRYAEPGADDTILPIAIGRDAFVSLTLNGLNRFYIASGEESAKELFLNEVRAQLEWFRSTAGWAEQRETKLPNMEAFGYAFRYTGDRDYLEAGLQILEYALSNCILRYYNVTRPVLDTARAVPAVYRFSEVTAIGSQILGLALIPMFSFLQTAEEAGALEQSLLGGRR